MTLENFNENLKKYARLIAETGVNVQDNHTVVLQISVDQAPLARLITEEAYRFRRGRSNCSMERRNHST